MPKNKPLSPGDSFFLLIESENTPSQIGVLARMKLPKGKDKRFIRELVEGFRKHQPTRPPFNLKLAERSATSPMYAWETVKNVDIDYHLRHSALPQPGGERELAVLISRLHSIPLDHRRPMWEFHVIEGLEDDCFAIYGKMHHALIDGVAGARLMSQWMSQTTPEVASDFLPLWAMKPSKRCHKPKDDPESSTPYAQALWATVSDPVKAITGVFSATLDSIIGTRSRKHPDLVAPYTAPRSILNSPVGPQRRVSTVEFSTQRLLKLGKTLGGTLNDVVMAICGGALRDYLIDVDALPRKPLIAQVPVSFRPKNDAGGGNAIGMMLASLGTDKEDALARFEKVRNSMSAGKELLADMSGAQITAYSAIMTLPFALGQMTGVGNRSKRPMYNVVISNVPGPRETRYFNGAEVYSMHPVSFVMQGQALNITLFTYADKTTFVFTACREALPSLQRLVTHTTDALEALESAQAKLENKSPAKRVVKRKPAAKKKPTKQG